MVEDPEELSELELGCLLWALALLVVALNFSSKDSLDELLPRLAMDESSRGATSVGGTLVGILNGHFRDWIRE